MKNACACFLFLAAVIHPASAGISLNFDMSALGNPDLDANSVYVSFGGNNSVMTYNGVEAINFSGGQIAYGNATYYTSRSFSLAEIAANGITIDSASSISGYISYGNGTAFDKMSTGLPGVYTSPQTPRYSQFEFTINSSNGTVTGGGADLTNITQFGGSLRLDFKAGNATQSYVGNTANTTAMFQHLAALSGSSPNAVVTSGGKYVRAVGANFYPASISGSFVSANPYGNFNNYFQSLYTGSGNGTSSVVNELTNLAPGAVPGGPGSAGFAAVSSNATRGITNNATYNLDYHFTATFSQATAPSGPSNPYGTYNLTLSGYVYATPSSGGNTTVYGAAATGNQTSGSSTPLTISIPADNLSTGNWTLSDFMYLQSLSNGNIAPLVTFGGWGNLTTDFGSATVSSALQQKAAGDFSQGILMGLVGSATGTVVPTSLTTNGTVALGNQTSYQWFKNSPDVGYSVAQPGNAFYSSWGSVISAYSAGDKNGVIFNAGGVYGNPYDDRFSLNTIAPDSSTTSMLITLLPDGTLTVPEPSAAALLLVCGGTAFLAMRFRAKKPSAS